jgi:hypothetical protein
MTALSRVIASIFAGLLCLAVGVSAGVASAFLAVSGNPLFGAMRSGPWKAWPGAVGPDADPYARAIEARDGRIPLGLSAGLRFLATADSSGRPLVGRCDYAVSGSTPPAQAWTIALLDPAGLAPGGPAGRVSFTSAEVVRALDGSFVVAVAPEAHPGNWLPVQHVDGFVLMLSIYDTPLGTAVRMGGSAPALPQIIRGNCR